jgi:o-succinylbenzoate synthase
MEIERIDLFHICMPMTHSFETSFGRWQTHDFVLVAAYCEGLIGWGECAAMDRPWYAYETSGTEWQILTQFLAPSVLGRVWNDIGEYVALTDWVRGHPMAKAGLQMAAWDLVAQSEGVSVAAKLAEPYPEGPRTGATVGRSLGIDGTMEENFARIAALLAQGYRRLKFKIKPGYDVDIVRPVRERFPTVPIMVDANSAYSLADVSRLKPLDDFDLLMIEQPLAHDDIVEHSQLQTQLRTRICLDESIGSVGLARCALALDAARIINIKPGRVGGLWEARQIHDLCRAHQVPVWCGGMQETGIGLAANLAIASLPGFSLPADISPTGWYWAQDVVEDRFDIDPQDGTIPVPQKPGLGITVDLERIKGYQVQARTLTA